MLCRGSTYIEDQDIKIHVIVKNRNLQTCDHDESELNTLTRILYYPTHTTQL